MADTKEHILITALRLFARDGYEAVSVSTIAGELGMTKGALYRHYQNKRDIFDSIVERMYQIDGERAQHYGVPEQVYEDGPEAYRNTSVASILEFTLAQFTFWTTDEFASDFRKMLTLEQYRSPEMARLYGSCLTAGPVAYMEDLFREMMERGILRKTDPRQLAVEYYAPLYLLISMFDGSGDQVRSAQLLRRHAERFFQDHAVNQ